MYFVVGGSFNGNTVSFNALVEEVYEPTHVPYKFIAFVKPAGNKNFREVVTAAVKTTIEVNLSLVELS